MEDVGIFCGHLIYFMVIWQILWPFDLVYSHLAYFVAIWNILWSFGICIFPRFGLLHQEKSGNPNRLPGSNFKALETFLPILLPPNNT
jgi:hypothetical protein